MFNVLELQNFSGNYRILRSAQNWVPENDAQSHYFFLCKTRDTTGVIVPETSWIWLDAGSPVGADGYVNFQGDGTTDSDNVCTHMTGDGTWIISSCNDGYGYACQATAGGSFLFLFHWPGF